MVFKSSINNGGGGGGSGVTTLNGLAGAINLTSTGNTITITPSGSTINLESTGGGSVSVDGITITGDGTSSNPLVAPFFDNNVFYFYNTASDISGYKVMNINANNTADFLDFFSVTDGQLLQSWATPVSSPNVAYFPAGIYSFQISAQQFTGSQTTQMYAEIWEVDSSGTDITLIGTTNYSAPLVTAPTLYSMVFSSQTVYYTTSNSSRIVVKVYVHVTGSGTATGVQIQWGQGNNSYISVPLAALPLSIGTAIPGASNYANLSIDGSGNLADGFTLYDPNGIESLDTQYRILFSAGNSNVLDFSGTNIFGSPYWFDASTSFRIVGDGSGLTGVIAPPVIGQVITGAFGDFLLYSNASGQLTEGAAFDGTNLTLGAGSTMTADYFTGDGHLLTNVPSNLTIGQAISGAAGSSLLYTDPSGNLTDGASFDGSSLFIGGLMSASTFAGNGDAITFTGSLDQIPFLNASNEFQFDPALYYDNAGHVLFAPAFSGDGSALTNITQTQVNTASGQTGFTGTCNFDAITPGNITSQTFVDGILTSVTTL